jgi:2-methylcitrate dehydratase
MMNLFKLFTALALLSATANTPAFSEPLRRQACQDYPGLASHPFTWEESVEKFDGLVAGRIDTGLSQEIKDAVLSLESIQVRDLVNLLSYAKAPSKGANDRGRNLSGKKTA